MAFYRIHCRQPPVSVMTTCPSSVPQGDNPTVSHFPDTLLCSSGVSLTFISYYLRKWVIQGNSSKPLLTLKFVSVSSLKAGFCAWTLVWFCHLNELIYRPVLSHLFTVVKTSLSFAVSLHPVFHNIPANTSKERLHIQPMRHFLHHNNFYRIILFLVCLSDGPAHRQSLVSSIKENALQIRLTEIPPDRSYYRNIYGIRMPVTYLR